MSLDRFRLGPLPQGSAIRRRRQELPGEAPSVPAARRFVHQVLQSWGRDEYDEAGTLLVSELATNAVLHARSHFVVELVDTGDGVVLAVSDRSPTLPVLRRHRRDAATGRGLWLLSEYAGGHGVDPTADGKQIWAVLCPASDAEEEPADGALARWLAQVDDL